MYVCGGVWVYVCDGGVLVYVHCVKSHLKLTPRPSPPFPPPSPPPRSVVQLDIVAGLRHAVLLPGYLDIWSNGVQWTVRAQSPRGGHLGKTDWKHH